MGLLAEKIGLAALCSLLVTTALLVALGLFWVELDFARLPLWVAVTAVGATAFAGLGVALGSLAREVRAASLLAFLLSLPVAFLALVPAGTLSGWVGHLVDGVCAVFPFKATLEALDVAVNSAPGGLAGPLLHLAALIVAYTAIARLALRRFA